MPKKGGKKISDMDPDATADEQNALADGAADGASSEAAPADAAAVPAATAKEDAGANAIEPKDLSKVARTKPAEAEAAEEAPAAPSGPPLSNHQRQLAGAWDQYQRTLDRQYLNVLQTLEKDVSSVSKSLQTMQAGAAETQKSVLSAKRYLSDIAQALDAVDTLVVPIVLQRDGNF
eukprot:CAMPEP_0172184126 /NCGR_PEP_ID=MMETSP1050-20130122/19393_1 /TAXON_ID=233186 /ORGANISM="Cryptomonas curvata, Strain CCAP979/52" /LENGTH=175 /DNA_ID=CAMNT_0012857871 /DNA_START=8 /DNA_END=535 /DNA_ORIENTATION=+